MERRNFDPSSFVRVRTIAEIERLSEHTDGVFVFELDDEKLSAIARHMPELRHLVSDGNTGVTDAGLVHLKRFSALESLDLEWSKVTDAGLFSIAAVQSLRWVDYSELRRIRPQLEVIFSWI